MLMTTLIDTLPFLTAKQLGVAAGQMEAEARVEAHRAAEALRSARSGMCAWGPETFAQLAEVKQRMADSRERSAYFYRLAETVRYETGLD